MQPVLETNNAALCFAAFAACDERDQARHVERDTEGGYMAFVGSAVKGRKFDLKGSARW